MFDFVVFRIIALVGSHDYIMTVYNYCMTLYEGVN